MKQKTPNFLLKKSTIASWGFVSLLGGFFFLSFAGINPFFGSQVTGNFISEGEALAFSSIGIVGGLLILCSAILIVYALARRE